MLLTGENSNANEGVMQFSQWFRDRPNLTQEALAQQLGVTQGRIAQLLRGDLPSMQLAARIAKITDGEVTANDFLAPQQVAS